MESLELNKIKKLYGERFAKLCRELFPTILEQEDVLYNILTSRFSENCKTLYEDIVSNGLDMQFKDYIYSKIDFKSEKTEEQVQTQATPYELLDKAGYDLFECKNEEEIQAFKKYYAQNEELCTFRGGRLNRCVVFFAVKKDVDKIKRENFKTPRREDEYGTSVMSIQFGKSDICMVSIKNRYNHRVTNPDATYGNDLDKIAPGLTNSFKELLSKRGLILNNSNVEELSIPNYTVADDGKYYKYNMEIAGKYYCPDNIIINYDYPIKVKNPEKRLLIDYFILDTEKKTLKLYDDAQNDSFLDEFKSIEKIEITKDKERKNGVKIITIKKENVEEPITIKIDKNNQIIEYKNNGLMKIDDDFLPENIGLEKLEIPNVKTVGDCFLYSNPNLEKLDLPNVASVGDFFLLLNNSLNELKLPKLKQLGNRFLANNDSLVKLELPNLTKVGNGFLKSNQSLEELETPNLPSVKERFLPIIRKNLGAKQITTRSIAKLDRESSITETELNSAREQIENLYNDDLILLY